jgi:hypothetical protein
MDGSLNIESALLFVSGSWQHGDSSDHQQTHLFSRYGYKIILHCLAYVEYQSDDYVPTNICSGKILGGQLDA